ncbi:MAG: YidC/Oxa1 family membrane protein insertase [Microthrixaceae bacterium]
MIAGTLAAGTFEGFFRIVTDYFGILYRITHSYGGAIILLTITVMILTAPLTLKSTKSMLQMQRHQPEMKRIQAEFKHDRDRMNQEMMALYKEHGINPVSGCVPMFLQAPVFFILYEVLRGITNRDGGSVSGIGRVAGQLASGQAFTPFRLRDQVFSPQHLSSGSTLYHSLSTSTKMNFFGIDLSLTPLEAIRIGIWFSAPFIVLIILMLVSQIYQQRQLQGRTQGQTVPAQQQMLMKVMPYALPLFSMLYPAGLSLYYFVQGLCRIGLQGYITKTVYAPHQEEMAKRSASVAPSSSGPEKDVASEAADVASPKPGTAPKKPGGQGGSKRSAATRPAGAKAAPARAGGKRSNGSASRRPSGTSGGRRSGEPRQGR